MEEKERKKPNKKILIGVLLLIIVIACSIFCLMKNLSTKENELEETEFKSYEDFLYEAKEYLSYTNLEKVSGELLLNANLLSSSYVEYKNYIVDCDNNDYYSEEETKETISEPTIMIRTYIDTIPITHTDFFSNNNTIELTLLNVNEYEFKGIYTEMDEKISDSNILSVKELQGSGNYKYYYNDTFIIFRVYIDNIAPVLVSSSIENNIINVNYEDDSSYDIYYNYSTTNEEVENMGNYDLMNNVSINCNTDYYIYTIAIDHAGNISKSSYIGEYNMKCSE